MNEYAQEYIEKKGRAADLLRKGDFPAAKKLYVEICAAKCVEARDWNNLAIINAKLGQIDECIQCSEMAIKYDRHYASAYYCIGTAYQTRSEYSLAAQYFQQAVQLNPANTEYIERYRETKYESLKARDITVRMVGDISIIVPATLECVTTYVLLEQEDWFENEINYIRELLSIGGCVLDIGANHGIYSCVMAKCVGDTGKVVAVEPASATANYLRRTVEHNEFKNIEIKQIALSDYIGEAKLSNNFYSELNAIVKGEGDLSTETVSVSTLDSLSEEFDCDSFQFVKIDAEGQEENIIRSGLTFFSNHSPLVMLEVRHNEELHLELLDILDSVGYRPYRLVTGLKTLVPFESDSGENSFQLNLFCCKRDTAEALEQKGLLLTSANAGGRDMKDAMADWTEFYESLAYHLGFEALWRKEDTQRLPGSEDYINGLACYAKSRNELLVMSERYNYLLIAEQLIDSSVDLYKTFSRLQSQVRLKWELGHQVVAATICAELVEDISGLEPGCLSESFIPACKRYEGVNPGSEPLVWHKACILEQYELIRGLNSFSNDVSLLKSLEEIIDTGFAGPEIERRYQLKKLQFGLQDKPVLSERLGCAEQRCLNAEYWVGGCN